MPPKDISLSADEKRAFDRLFDNADTEQLGVLTGDKAVPFFEASELPGQVLGEIWALADDENTGFLTKEAFYVVCRLIGYAQRGQQPTAALAKKSGPLPYFKGMHVPGLPEQRPSPSTPQKQVPTATRGGMTISPEDKAKYTRLFYNSHPSAGLLDGEKARDIFTKSRLPNDKLGQIWNLADTKSRGALDATDFVIAMHLIHGSMNGSIPRLPDTLPVSLYAQAAAGAATSLSSMPTSPIRAQNTGLPASPALYAQPTGSSLLNRTSAGAALPLSASQRSMSLGQSQGGGNWAIDPIEKSQSDQFFDMLDTSRQGVLQGEIAVPFFVQSGLPEETLAQIWDLSDIRKEGSLTKDEFAVARRLVMDVLAGKQLPDQLDQSMIPPSLRAIAQQLQNQPQQSEVQRDLFSLMDDDEPSQLPPAAIASGASAFQPVTPAARVASPLPIQPVATGGSGRSVGQSHGVGTPARQDSGLHHRSPPPPVPAHRTHSSHTIVTSPAQHGTPSHGFFDSTPTEEKGNQIPANSAEIGNLQNQVRETQRSVSSLRQERTALSGNVAKTEAEIDELKSALAQAKAAFDTESTNMTNLETRFKTGSEELKKLREELIHAESELSALREQKAETEQNILKDKEEIRGLKINLKATNDEVATLKETLEKLRKEARQQKGLVVVSKKQLATSEADKEKITKSINEEREQAHAMHTRSPSVTDTAPAVPLPSSTGASPAASVHSNRSMNPFFAHTSGARVTSPLQASVVPVSQEVDADPFGLAPRPVEAPQPHAPAQPTGFGFDDDFESAFNPPASSAPVAPPTTEEKGKSRALSPETGHEQSHGDTDFDAAFADFDKPVPQGPPAVPQTSSTSALTTDNGLPEPARTGSPKKEHAAADTVHDVEEKATNLTGSAAVGATVGALAGAGVAAVSKAQDLFGGETEGTPDRSVASPSSMQPYESRQLPEAEESGEIDDSTEGDEELAPIRDVEQEDSDSDSDSEADSDANINARNDLASPFASAEDTEAISATDPTTDIVSRDVHDEPLHTGQSLVSDPFPGAFPAGTSSRPASSAGDPEEQFEDAHAEQHERSASPAGGPATTTLSPSAAGTDTSNETEPLRSPAAAILDGSAVRSTDASKPGPTLGFDDSFDSPFKAMTPASNDSPAPAEAAVQQEPDSNTHNAVPDSNTHTAAPSTEIVPAVHQVHQEEVSQQTPAVKSEPSDAFDDFEDLAPAKVEDVPATIVSPPQSARNPDFDSNFDDDFGFDNQTFSHTNAQQSSTREGGSSGFDDNFDSAFDIPAASPAAANDTQPPALPARTAAVGFDDDFFSSPTEPPSQASQQQQSQAPQGFTYTSAVIPPKRQSYDVPPAGEPPAHTQQSNTSGPAAYAPPAGPPPQQSAQNSIPAPPLPARNDTDDGDLPQVKELVGMGFNRKQAIAALEDNQFDLERAANALLSVNH